MKKPKNRKPNNYWTLNLCLECSVKCNTKTEWLKRYPASYKAAWKNGWIKECSIHMNVLVQPKGLLTKEHCHKMALKCKNRKEFRKKYPSEFNVSYRGKFYNEICSHMERLGDNRFRALYVFEYSDNSVYVGLTWNYQQRYKYHIKENKLLINKRYLSNEIYKELGVFYPKDIAAIKEQELIEEYRANEWTILNKKKGGGLGGSTLIWNKKSCIKDSKNYTIIGEWIKKSHSAYRSALHNGWLSECISHMSKTPSKKRKSIQCIETNEIFESITRAAILLKISPGNISSILKGKRKSTKGFTFKYL